MTDIVERMQRDLNIGCSASIGDTKKAIAEIERLREELRYYECDCKMDKQDCDMVMEAETEIEIERLRKTLRDQFAMAALRGSMKRFASAECIAEDAYEIADAMMKAREAK